MQHAWTEWFRERQSEGGRTIEAFAREAGINTSSVNGYRAGRIPRGPNLAAIVRVLGEAGPLPEKTQKEREETIEEILASLDLRVTELEARIAMPLSDLQILDLRTRLGLVQGDQQRPAAQSPLDAEAQ